MQVCIEQGVPVYIDLSDPLEYIEAAVDMAPAAAASGTAAVVSAGAFPGLSNVLAVQLTRQLPAPPADIKFSYFTAGTSHPALAWCDSCMHATAHPLRHSPWLISSELHPPYTIHHWFEFRILVPKRSEFCPKLCGELCHVVGYEQEWPARVQVSGVLAL